LAEVPGGIDAPAESVSVPDVPPTVPLMQVVERLGVAAVTTPVGKMSVNVDERAIGTLFGL
jgi:hypothetical protein